METSREVRNLQALAVELPEDIIRLKEHGDLELALKVIDRRLEKPIPQIMRERLLLEKEILAQMPAEYPYTWESALEELKKTFRDFREDELKEFLLDGAFEWIYLNGQMRIKDDFIANLIKTREELADRVLKESMIAGKWENFRMLDAAVARMKAQDSVRCRFRIRSTVQINSDKEQPEKKVQVQLPLPLEYHQVKAFRLIESSPVGAKIAPALCDQRTICFEGIYPAGQKFMVEYEFETEMKYWDWRQAINARGGAMERNDGRMTMESETAAAESAEISAESTAESAETATEMAEYLGEQLPHIRFTPYLRALVREVTGEEADPLKKAKLIYDYITTHVMYSFVRSYFTIPQQVTYIASGMKGDCGLQALLFITMCRIAGIPAGWQSGLYANPRTIGCHDWAEFYIEPYGWLFADCSFGGAAYRAGHPERWEFYFGNLEPYRLPAARGYQKDFCFPKKYLRTDPYDNQRGEAEYENMGLLEGVDFDTTHEVLKVELE